MSKFTWNRDDFQRVYELAVEESLRWAEELPERKVRPDATLSELRAGVDVELSSRGVNAESTIRHLIAAARPGLIASPGPRFYGFVIGGGFPVAVAADWLASSWDQNAGLYSAAPSASIIEETAARWILDLLGLPRTCSIGFVTGCQMANTTALAAARHSVLRDAGWNVEDEGLQGAPQINVLVGEQAHATIFTALRLVGLGQERAIRVASDDEGRMRADALREALAGVEGPTIVCAQAGNVNSGAFDPFEEIIHAAREKNAWVHVDGAFGLWALASPDYAALATGVRAADSWATDAHKWLNVPYDSGLVIVRDRSAHAGATSVRAAYLIHAGDDEGAARDPLDWTPEFSRRARGLAIYATLMYLGREGVAELVDRGCRNATQIAERLSREDGITILNEVVHNQVLVDFEPPAGTDHDSFVHDLIRRIQEDGTLWLSGTQWRGRAAMRISVSSWATSEKDVERSSEAIIRLYEG